MKMKINSLYNMDCLKGIQLLENDSIDLVITSPPYNIGRKSYPDNMRYSEYLSFLHEVFSSLYLKLCNGGRICLNIGDKNNGKILLSHHISHILETIGYLSLTKIIWNKRQTSCRTAWGSWASPSCPSFPCPVEYILVFCKNNRKLQKKGISDLHENEFTEWAYGIWEFSPESQMVEKYNHDAVFPKELPRRCIKMFSWIGALVLDPFSGVGTTASVALELGRNYIGFEILENHHNTALRRIEQKKKDLALRLIK